MRRLLLTLLIVPLALAGCSQSGSESPPSEPPVASATPEPTGEALPAGSAADNYCSAVDEFITTFEKSAKDPLDADMAAVNAKAQELRRQATELAGELFDNPEGIAQVQQCTERLQKFTARG